MYHCSQLSNLTELLVRKASSSTAIHTSQPADISQRLQRHLDVYDGKPKQKAKANHCQQHFPGQYWCRGGRCKLVPLGANSGVHCDPIVRPGRPFSGYGVSSDAVGDFKLPYMITQGLCAKVTLITFILCDSELFRHARDHLADLQN